jgi:hypothetical protein
MKINQKFTNKAIFLASFSATLIGVNSIFNESQAYITSGKVPLVAVCFDQNYNICSFGASCDKGSQSCVSNKCPCP